MVKKKTKSHRQTLSKKYMVAKKVKEHKRKLVKAAKKGGLSGHRSKKDPGIPNLFPFKQDLLRSILKEKEAVEAAAEQRTAQRKRDRKRKLLEAAADAEHNHQEYTQERDAKRARSAPNGKRLYFRELRKVIEESDVLIEVLDARDPLGCRSEEIEDRVLRSPPGPCGKPKRLIVLLNKIDLVPAPVVEKWLQYLSQFHATIAFKASTQNQRHNIGRVATSKQGSKYVPTQAELDSTRHCIGAGTLLNLLGQYRLRSGAKTSLVVGVIGYPNVGKSSVINSLKRSRAVGVANTPGFTKTVQHVRIDQNITIVDSPGVLFVEDHHDPTVVLRNCVNSKLLPEAVLQDAAFEIVRRCDHVQLMQIFSIPEFGSDPERFLYMIGAKGFLKQDSVPDLRRAAMHVLDHWNNGKIPYYCTPPDISDQKQSSVDSTAKIVESWSAGFDIDSLLSSNREEVRTIRHSSTPSTFVPMRSLGAAAVDFTGMDVDESSEGDLAEFDPIPEGVHQSSASMDVDMTDSSSSSTSLDRLAFAEVRAKKTGGNETVDSGTSSAHSELNATHNRDLKKQQKKDRRRSKRRLRSDSMVDDGDDDEPVAASAPSSSATNVDMTDSGMYDFSTDWK